MEPASTRKRYSTRGFEKAMLTAVWIRCRENVVNCTYVELYGDWREKFMLRHGSEHMKKWGFGLRLRRIIYKIIKK